MSSYLFQIPLVNRGPGEWDPPTPQGIEVHTPKPADVTQLELRTPNTAAEWTEEMWNFETTEFNISTPAARLIVDVGRLPSFQLHNLLDHCEQYLSRYRQSLMTL